MLRRLMQPTPQKNNQRTEGLLNGMSGFELCSEAMRRVYDEIGKYAQHGRNCILFGPSGAGKEFAARHYHRVFLESRNLSAAPFVSLNCACLTPAMALSELFGHTDDAFTSAKRHREGLFFEADRGVLFLDEVGDLAQEVQAYLLRALDPNYGAARKLGSNVERATTSVTVVCATERQPQDIRPSLLVRFDKQVFIPGIDERKEEIPGAVLYFLRRAIYKCRDAGEVLQRYGGLREKGAGAGLMASPEAICLSEALARPLIPLVLERSWPMNFRALGNALDAAIVCADRKTTLDAFIDEVVGRFNEHADRYSEWPNLSSPIPVLSAGPMSEGSHTTVAALEPPSDLLQIVTRILPRSRDKAGEAAAVARFLASRGTNAFARQDLQSRLPTRLGNRAMQHRLSSLVQAGLLQRTGGRGEYYRRPDPREATPEMPKPLPCDEFALPQTRCDGAAEIRGAGLLPLLGNAHALFVGGSEPQQRTRMVVALGRKLQAHRPVLYSSFEKLGMSGFLSLIEARLFSEMRPALQSLAAGLDDLRTRVALCSGYLDELFGEGEKPVFILDGVDALYPVKDHLVIAWLIRMWPGCTFIISGTKLDNEMQASAGGVIVEAGTGAGPE